MINLLPYGHKKEIRAARVNVILVRYIAILGFAVLVLAGLVAGVFFTLSSARTVAEDKVAENQQRMAEYQPIKQEADAFRSDLSTAKSVLDSSVSFSKLIYKIADTIPPNVILSDLPLDPANFGTSMTLQAGAKSFGDAAKLRDAFRQNGQVFSNVQIQNIRSDGAGGAGDSYPVKVTLSVIINKEALR